jgi:small ligand-binding sensory domain FIST
MSTGIGIGFDWRAALDQALGDDPPAAPALAMVFASSHFHPAFVDILAEVRERLAPGHLIGCSGQAVIGGAREVEGQPALSVLALELPGAELKTAHMTRGQVAALGTPESWHAALDVAPEDVNAWLVLSDPFTFDPDALLAGLGSAYPGKVIVGGMASSFGVGQNTQLFHGGNVLHEGALLLAVGGGWTVQAVVSQGAAPIGQTWTITESDRNVIRAIGGRPPLEVLIETMRDLEPSLQQRASRNLLVGLAMDEYRDTFGRGDFLIRNLIGVDQASGAIAIGDQPRVGQTVQFQVRDAHAADEELTHLLGEARAALGETQPAGALLCACNGRGAGLFGMPNHDAEAVAGAFGALPLAGFFCNGEIGPVGGKHFVHGFTASIAFFVPVAGA